MKTLVIFQFLFFTFVTVSSQSINGVWVSKDSSTCINFDSTKYRMNIKFWIEKDWTPVENKFIYKIKNDTLKVVYNYYGRRSITYYKINFLWDGKISLSIIRKGNSSSVEIIGGNDVEYVKFNTCNSCR